MENWVSLALMKDVVLFFLLSIAFGVAMKEGVGGLVRVLTRAVLYVPGVETLLNSYLRKEVRVFLRHSGILTPRENAVAKVKEIPKEGLSEQELLSILRKKKSEEFNPHTGKGFAYVYTLEDSRFKAIKEAYNMYTLEQSAIEKKFLDAFMHENALNPMVFPNLRHFEVEIVAMTSWMLHGGEGVVGHVTSGGTESILMAIKTYRDRARDLCPHITKPEVVAPVTIHPAFEKAACYFDVKIVHVPITSSYVCDVKAYEKAIGSNTILLLGSAPEYTYGIIDPLSDISSLALRKGLPFHVDACFGGFVLPWIEKLGYNMPEFDFRLKGVTSMTADIHKYGLGPKGASCVLYRSNEIRKYQIFTYATWPGGLFGSPSMAGTRPGGNLASSWAAIMSLGQNGYLNVAKELMNVTSYLIRSIKEMEEVEVCGKPQATAFAITSNSVNIFAISDQMEEKGWKVERISNGIHCSILPSHTFAVARQFIGDLKTSINKVKAMPSLASSGSAAVYGMAGRMPDKSVIKKFLVEFFCEVYTYQ